MDQLRAVNLYNKEMIIKIMIVSDNSNSNATVNPLREASY